MQGRLDQFTVTSHIELQQQARGTCRRLTCRKIDIKSAQMSCASKSQECGANKQNEYLNKLCIGVELHCRRRPIPRLQDPDATASILPDL